MDVSELVAKALADAAAAVDGAQAVLKEHEPAAKQDAHVHQLDEGGTTQPSLDEAEHRHQLPNGQETSPPMERQGGTHVHDLPGGGVTGPAEPMPEPPPTDPDPENRGPFEASKSELPILRVPDPEFLMKRLTDGHPAGILSRRQLVSKLGDPQLLVGPHKRGETPLAHGLVVQGGPVSATSLGDMHEMLRAGVDEVTVEKFEGEEDFYYLPLKLMVAFDPPSPVTECVKEEIELAVWSTAFINDLPDSAFLHIKPGGSKDGEGKTVPRDLRMFPVRGKDGKIDLPHLRNALARIPQANLPQSTKDRLTAQAQRLLANAQKSVSKHEDGEEVRILKRDTAEDTGGEKEERFVFGVVLVPNDTDAHGDAYDEETVRKAAHSFMENGGVRKIMHRGAPIDGVTVLETYVTKTEETHGGEVFPVGTWLMAVRVTNDALWEAVLDGTFTGFSMGGSAIRRPVAPKS